MAAAFSLLAFESHRYGLSLSHLLIYLGYEIAGCFAGLFLIWSFYRRNRPILELLLSGWAVVRVLMVVTHVVVASVDQSANGAMLAARIVQYGVLALAGVGVLTQILAHRQRLRKGGSTPECETGGYLWMVFGLTAVLVVIRMVVSYEGHEVVSQGDNLSYENQVVHYCRKGFDPLFMLKSFPHIIITSHYHLVGDIPVHFLFRVLLPFSNIVVLAVGLSALIGTRNESPIAGIIGPIFILFFTCMDHVFFQNPEHNWYGPSRNTLPLQILFNPYVGAFAISVWSIVVVFRVRQYRFGDLLLIFLTFAPMAYFRPFIFYPCIAGFIAFVTLRGIDSRRLPIEDLKVAAVLFCGVLILVFQFQAKNQINKGPEGLFPSVILFWGRIQKWTLINYFERAPLTTLNVLLMIPLQWVLGLGVASIAVFRGLCSKRMLLATGDDSKVSWLFYAGFAGYTVPTILNFEPDIGNNVTQFATTFFVFMAIVFWMDTWKLIEQSRYRRLWLSLVILQMVLVFPFTLFFSRG